MIVQNVVENDVLQVRSSLNAAAPFLKGMLDKLCQRPTVFLEEPSAASLVIDPGTLFIS